MSRPRSHNKKARSNQRTKPFMPQFFGDTYRIGDDRHTKAGHLSPTPEDIFGALAERLERKFANRPDWHRPEIWPIVFDHNRASQRHWLSEALASLSDTQQRNVLRRLEKNEQFLATYNELGVVSSLDIPGFRTEYEPKLFRDNRYMTPDLALYSPKGNLFALVEVSTRFRKAEHRSQETQWKELKQRVSRIPSSMAVLVRYSALGSHRPPTSGRAKEIEAELRPWLLQTHIRIGSTLGTEDYSFEVVGVFPGLRTELVVPTSTSWHNTDMIRDAIAEKTDRYADWADYLDVPLMVIISAEPAVPLSVDLMQAALEGKQALSFALSPFTFEPVSTGPMRLNERDVPATFHPALSAVGLFEPGIDNPGKLTLIDIPGATRKMPVFPMNINVARRII